MNTPPTQTTIAELRKLTPVRPLTLSDAYAIAELHATKLLQLRGVHAPGPVDLLWIRDVPRVRIILRPRHEMPTLSGFTQWEDGTYQIFVNKNAGLGRRRFTLAHEFGHVITWNAKRVVYSRLGHGDKEKHDRQVERITDHFAACLLMPRRFVKQAWTMGIQDIEALAELFRVSTEAMRVRLTYSGTHRRHRAAVRDAIPPRELAVQSPRSTGRLRSERRHYPCPSSHQHESPAPTACATCGCPHRVR